MKLKKFTNLISRKFSYINMASGNLIRKMTENIQTNILPTTDYAMVNKTFDKIMVASGIIALVWILAFLLVAMIDK